MRLRSRSVFSLSVLLMVALLCRGEALADISKCNGVWTNKPCDAEPKHEMPELKPTPRPPAQIEMDHKKILIQDLDLKRVDARQRAGIEIGIANERSQCLSADTPLAECARIVDAKEREIADSVAKAERHEEKRQQREEKSQSSEPSVVIVQQPEDIFQRRHHDGLGHDEHGKKNQFDQGKKSGQFGSSGMKSGSGELQGRPSGDLQAGDRP